MERYLCIHCHFYQPPRENPWLEAVELQDSAYPYHDWNERITAECYAPNAAARLLDAQGRIQRIVNNYARISFNFGPTLLSWLEENRPEVYQAILEADAQSRERFSGHGSALAQAYNHMILPLANRADKHTQVLWGLRDFERRFGRPAEGMWLPEAAVDSETLQIVADLGIKFVVLAPRQAGRVRRLGGRWKDISGGRIDPTRAYLKRLPQRRSIALFFYDGPISQAVAFEKLLDNGDRFTQRLMSGFSDQRTWPQLVHIATDGETYGHHHRHGEMALAYAIEQIETHGQARLTNYGEYLERHPPEAEADIVENSSWSCVHGVERWRADCGCNTGGRAGWNQKWRGPLREALDWLRDQLAPRYEPAARPLLKDPWTARNDYIEVVLDRSPESLDRFFARHAAAAEIDRVAALKLLEMQRHAMLMYTSCGWFFNELSGIETVQVIAYAGRAVQLAQELFGDHLEQEFLARLALVRSNLPELGDGATVYNKWVRPAALDLEKVGAHYAISSLFERYADRDRLFCYEVDREEHRLLEGGRARLAVGRGRVTSLVTRESGLYSYAALHLGDQALSAGVRPFISEEAFQSLVSDASGAFLRAEIPETIRILDRHFGGVSYSIKSLFRDQQRKIVELILDNTLAEAEASFRQIYERHAALMRFLGESGLPMPRALAITAEFVVNSSLRREFEEEEPALDRIQALLDVAQRERLALDAAGLAFALKGTLERMFERLRTQPEDREMLERLAATVDLVRSLPFAVDLWKVQNLYYELWREVRPAVQACAAQDAQAWLAAFDSLAEKLSLRLPEQAPQAMEGVA